MIHAIRELIADSMLGAAARVMSNVGRKKRERTFSERRASMTAQLRSDIKEGRISNLGWRA